MSEEQKKIGRPATPREWVAVGEYKGYTLVEQVPNRTHIHNHGYMGLVDGKIVTAPSRGAAMRMIDDISSIVIISRHPATIQFIKDKLGLGDNTPIIPHVSTPDQVAGKWVIGNIPYRLACHAKRLTILEVEVPPSLRGTELSLDELNSLGATLVDYKVVK